MKKTVLSQVILILIALGGLGGISTWTEFKNSERKPILYLDQVSNATKDGVRYPQSIEIITNLYNRIEPALQQDIIGLEVTQKLPVGFTISEIQVTFPDATKTVLKSVETPRGFQYDLKVRVKPGERLAVSTVLRSSLNSSTGNLTTVATATYRYPGIFGIGAENRTLTQSTSTVIRVRFEAWYSVLRDIKDQNWLMYVLANNLCIEDGKLNDQEVTYLRHPTPENADRLLKSYLSVMNQIPEIGPQLATEFPKIPDVRPNNATVEALEDIVSRALRSTKDERKVFEVMLKEGIPARRKFNALLQGLEWYCEENELMGRDPIAAMSSTSESVIRDRMYSFIEEFWVEIFGTRKLNDPKWKDFQTVVDRLSTPELIAIYVRYNFKYISRSVWDSAIETFLLKGGNCASHSIFATWCMEEHGYEAYALGATPTERQDGWPNWTDGHAVTQFKYPNIQSPYFFDSTEFWGRGGIHGPYDSVGDIADYILNKLNKPKYKVYARWDRNWKEIETVRRRFSFGSIAFHSYHSKNPLISSIEPICIIVSSGYVSRPITICVLEFTKKEGRPGLVAIADLIMIIKRSHRQQAGIK